MYPRDVPIATQAPQTPPLTPTHDQTVVYAVVIFGIWNIPVARTLINPLKLFTIGWHEFCHIVAAVLTGGTISSVTIDPNLGGATIVEGGRPPIILAAGYVGSSVFGGAFILAGFDSLVAKILSFVLGLGLITPLVLVRDKLTILLTLFYEGDLTDDKFFRKANDSDCTQFNLMFPRISAHVWACFWIMFQTGVCISFLFIGIVSFKVRHGPLDGRKPYSVHLAIDRGDEHTSSCLLANVTIAQPHEIHGFCHSHTDLYDRRVVQLHVSLLHHLSRSISIPHMTMRIHTH
ncbi:peptidase M50B-like-domain-containing protein [Suillus cothurnatus]|nr:peptidase M50B-like-domain-containing protein [Suillus cothurnatus]